MRKLNYAIYRGTIYKKYEGAIYAYSYKCVVKAFVNSLAANYSFKVSAHSLRALYDLYC